MTFICKFLFLENYFLSEFDFFSTVVTKKKMVKFKIELAKRVITENLTSVLALIFFSWNLTISVSCHKHTIVLFLLIYIYRKLFEIFT